MSIDARRNIAPDGPDRGYGNPDHSQGDTMSLAIWFWLFWAIGLLFGGYVGYQGRAANQFWFGGPLIYTILFFLLGFAVFGSPVHH